MKKVEFTELDLGKVAFEIYSISSFVYTQDRNGYNIYDSAVDKDNFICHCGSKREVTKFLECFKD